MALYQRESSIIIYRDGARDTEIKGLKISFTITKNHQQNTNTAEVKIYNLPKQKFFYIDMSSVFSLEIFAGYSQYGGKILAFRGDITKTKRTFVDKSYVTTFTVVDGFFPFTNKFISISEASGVTARSLISQIAESLGMTLDMAASAPDRAWAHGYSYYGSAVSALDTICKATALEWSIQSNSLQIIKRGGMTSRPAVKLTQDSGMIDHTEITIKNQKAQVFVKNKKPVGNPYIEKITSSLKDGQTLKVYSLMRPEIIPGDLVQVDYFGVPTYCRVETIQHIGDTHPEKDGDLGSWISVIQLVSTIEYQKNANSKTLDMIKTKAAARPKAS